MLLTLVGGLTSELFSLEASLLTLLSFVPEPSPKTARRMFYGSLLYLPSWLNFCYIGCLMKRRTIWLRKVSLTEFCMGLICRTKNRNAKTGIQETFSCAITPSSCLCFCGSIPFPTCTHIWVLKTFSGSSCSRGTVGTMYSCIFGLHEFLPSRGVLGASVVKIIEYIFLDWAFCGSPKCKKRCWCSFWCLE